MGEDQISLDEKKVLSDSKNFAEEAKWDIKVAKELSINLDFNGCESDDQTFYLGRRAFFFLQQAVEKTSKAYLLLFRLRLLRMASSSWYTTLPQDKKVKLENLLKELEPKQVSHFPHVALLRSMSQLLISAEENNFMNHFEQDYKELLSKFEDLYKEKALKAYEPILLSLNNAFSAAFDRCANVIFNNSEFESIKKTTLDACKIISNQSQNSRNFLNNYPPYIENTLTQTLKTVENLKHSLLNEAIITFENEKDSFSANIMRRQHLKLTEDQQKEFRRIFRDSPDLIYCIFSFNFVFPSEIVLMSSSLVWYEEGDRYTNVNHFDRNNICKDITKIDSVIKEADSMLDIVNKAINWKERSWVEKQFSNIVQQLLF